MDRHLSKTPSVLLIPHTPFTTSFQEAVTPLPGYDNARYYPYREAGSFLDVGNEDRPWRVWDRKKGYIAFYGCTCKQALERCRILNTRWERQMRHTRRAWRVHPLYIGYWKVDPRKIGFYDGTCFYKQGVPKTLTSVRRQGTLRAHLYPASLVPNGWGCERYLAGFVHGFAVEEHRTWRTVHRTLREKNAAERKSFREGHP